MKFAQNRRHFAHDIFKYSFLNENYCILIQISLKFVPGGPIYNSYEVVRVIHLTRDKPLFEQSWRKFASPDGKELITNGTINLTHP